MKEHHDSEDEKKNKGAINPFIDHFKNDIDEREKKAREEQLAEQVKLETYKKRKQVIDDNTTEVIEVLENLCRAKYPECEVQANWKDPDYSLTLDPRYWAPHWAIREKRKSGYYHFSFAKLIVGVTMQFDEENHPVGFKCLRGVREVSCGVSRQELTDTLLKLHTPNNIRRIRNQYFDSTSEVIKKVTHKIRPELSVRFRKSQDQYWDQASDLQWEIGNYDSGGGETWWSAEFTVILILDKNENPSHFDASHYNRVASTKHASVEELEKNLMLLLRK